MTRLAVDWSRVERILIIKMSALGDVIHALPVSAALGEAFPHIQLSWVVEDTLAPLLTGNPYISELHTVPKLRGSRLRERHFRDAYFARLREIRKQRFDIVIDLQGLTKSAIVAVASGARYRIGYHWLREAAPLVEYSVPQRPESVHIVEQYLDVAHYLGAEVTTVKFPFDIPEEDSGAANAMLCESGIEIGQPFVSINPAAGHPLKQWGEHNFAALIDALQTELGMPVALVTADRKVAAQVQAMTCSPFANLAGRTSLKQLAAVLARSTVHVCGDTGSGHMAAALGTPVVSLIGPTDPDRACPYGQRALVMERKDLCDPRCTWHHCAHGQTVCLQAIEYRHVLGNLQHLLAT